MKLTILGEHGQHRTGLLSAFWLMLICIFFALGWILSDNLLQTKLLISEVVGLPSSSVLSKEDKHSQERAQAGKAVGAHESDEHAQKKESKTASQGYASKDWLTLEPQRMSRVNGMESCPYWNDICVHNGHFYVRNDSETFELQMQHWDLLGQLVDVESVVSKSNDVYRQFFKAEPWNQSRTQDEYNEAKCAYHPIVNHMILEAKYMTMLGESESVVYVPSLILGKVYALACPTYHRFTEPHLAASVSGACSFVAFFWDTLHVVHNTTRHPLHPIDLPSFGSLGLYPIVISSLNQYIDSVDIYLQRDTLLFKQTQLTQILKSMSPHSPVVVPLNQVPKWRVIGFYQRIVRRRWTNLDDILRNCNTMLNPFFIACDSILLEGFLHSRDVVIKHRIFDLVFGIHGTIYIHTYMCIYIYMYIYLYIYVHIYIQIYCVNEIGAHLQDAIWMRQNGSFIVELMPAMGDPWASSLDEPTLVGYTYWDTQFNYFGLQLPNDSIVWTTDRPQREQDWSRRNFQVRWSMLVDIIHFLMIDGGGFCNTFKSGKNVVVPAHIQNYGFAVFNAFCPGDDKPYHYTKPKGDHL
ncbi:hypothetical protein RFI_11560 [Reticulomyxa filosa]|uniref:Uncharacterized protein n=1 Tax=Reticulomyxa filosa TaxID=46433 RepID=X6NHT6_RETFI|nr:hypothetical protein RFI_11560 [Reticulomyxa filosa]|eukprot:ETO25576.1 hypothetical protein RFI_11560 [Reticulomyxa filosa]